VTSFGEAADIDPQTIWVPLLPCRPLHVATFLFLWWRLRGDVSLARFLSLSGQGLVERSGSVW